MDAISSLLNGYCIERIVARKGSVKGSERGEFLSYFAKKTGRTIGYIAKRLEGVPTGDLYAFKQMCDAYEKQGKPWAKCFFGRLKAKP